MSLFLDGTKHASNVALRGDMVWILSNCENEDKLFRSFLKIAKHFQTSQYGYGKVRFWFIFQLSADLEKGGLWHSAMTSRNDVLKLRHYSLL